MSNIIKTRLIHNQHLISMKDIRLFVCYFCSKIIQLLMKGSTAGVKH